MNASIEPHGMEKAKEAGSWEVRRETVNRVAPGIVHTARTVVGRDMLQSVHIIEADPADPYVRAEVYSSGGTVSRLETVGGMLAELEAAGKRIVAGVNGDFFSYAGVPSGLQIADGEVYTAPNVTKTLLAVMPDGNVKLKESVAMNALLTNESGLILPIDAINRAHRREQGGQAVLYNFRYGKSTRTSAHAAEAVIAVSEGGASIRLGVGIGGIVRRMSESPDTPIGEGELVVSATGPKADWLAKNLTPGLRVRIGLSLDSELSEARQVVSGSSTLGFVLLKDGEVPSHLLDPAVRTNSDRHPRTMLAVARGKLYLVTFDGRQPGHSDGITLAEGAYYLQSIGMEHAINIDGGGSTACYVRRPGRDRPVLCNRPSDGFERAVGNGLFLASTAPVSELSEFVIDPAGEVRVLAGGRIRFEAKGRDAAGNAVSVSPERLSWEAEGTIGRLDRTGLLIAGPHAGDGRVVVRSGSVRCEKTVIVADRVHRLQLEPSQIVLEPGGTVRLLVSACDERGGDVCVSADQLVWSVEGCAGTVTEDGVFRAADRLLGGEGKVTAAYGSVKAHAAVRIGLLPRTIADFETLDRMRVQERNTVPGAVRLSPAARPQPVRYGTFSAKLTYDFTGMAGLSEASVIFEDYTVDLADCGGRRPIRFSLWAFGDGRGHTMRLTAIDRSDRKFDLDLAGKDGLHWKGWKYVYADVPESMAFPVRVHALTVAETDEKRKGAGAVYLDLFRAEYMDLGEDVDGPLIRRLTPEPGSASPNRRPAVGAFVTDEGSGVHPSSIRLWLNGTLADHRYDPSTGQVEYVPSRDLPDGEYEAKIEAADKNGTSALPPAVWTFRIDGKRPEF
ncbi:phosphodiester glycosidase family protein [Paenibacillus sp. GYB003]|uniref:phosphodiester glycosidase family protein n=1 Tax=Paenibacillus sp. GYB003 TaxID=2994392 RepID=UPI002F9684D8